jgi:hypothetical protein
MRMKAKYSPRGHSAQALTGSATEWPVMMVMGSSVLPQLPRLVGGDKI